MTKKKTVRTAKTKKTAAPRTTRKRRRASAPQWQKVVLGLALLALLVASVAFLAERMIGPAPSGPPPEPRPPATEAARPAGQPLRTAKRPADPPAAVASKAARRTADGPEPSHPGAAASAPHTAEEKVPVFEVYPQRDLPAPEEPGLPELPEPPSPDRRPRVAIIIDDLGHNRNMARKLLDLDPNLTASILPGSPFQKSIAAMSRRKGIEIMVHLPMEPDEYPAVDPGPGALLASMAPDHLIAQLEAELDSLPDAKGVNNHMGSRLTRESPQMQQVFSVLKQRNLYFVDSLTSARSVGRSTARLFRVPFAERDVFLDHVNTPEFVRGQIRKLIREAQRQGQAVGIAHPHETTYAVLKQMLPELKRHVRLVPASQVVQSW